MSIKIPAGLTACVVPDPTAADENVARARAGGSTFRAPWLVWVRGPLKKLPRGFLQVYHDQREIGQGVAVYPAFNFIVDGLTPRFSITGRFPYEWAPAAMRDVTAWLETDTGITVYETTTEEVKTNG